MPDKVMVSWDSLTAEDAEPHSVSLRSSASSA